MIVNCLYYLPIRKIWLIDSIKSDTAALVNVQIMRAFVKMREALAGQTKILTRIDNLERTTTKHDKELRQVFTAIKELLGLSEKDKKKKIGFE